MNQSMVLEVFHFTPAKITHEVERLVEAALHRTPQLCGCSLDCEQEGDTVVLRGRVPSYYTKQIAQTVAAQVEGVERIVNELEVVSLGCRH